MPDNYVHLGPDRRPVSERHAHLLSPRPPRHRRFVLVDRLSKRPLDERDRTHRLALSPARAIDESLAEACCRRRSTRLIMKTRWPISREPRGGWSRLAASIGTRRVSTSTAPAGPSGPRASHRSASRCTRARSAAGRTTRSELADLFAALPQDHLPTVFLNSIAAMSKGVVRTYVGTVRVDGIQRVRLEITDFRALPDLWLIVRGGFDRFSECEQRICACESYRLQRFCGGNQFIFVRRLRRYCRLPCISASVQDGRVKG